MFAYMLRIEGRYIYLGINGDISMGIDLKTIEARLAKAKEEAEFWEKARAVLDDPRLKALSGLEVQTVNNATPTIPAAIGSLRNMVYEVLPDPDAGLMARITTTELVSKLEDSGYVFNSKEPMIAVNSALVALEDKGFAEWQGKRGLAKLWRKKRQKSQEASEEAS